MNELKITFLGSGSAFYNDVDNFQSNLLLECQGRSLLLDCGTDIRFSMREAGKKLTGVTDIQHQSRACRSHRWLGVFGVHQKVYP